MKSLIRYVLPIVMLSLVTWAAGPSNPPQADSSSALLYLGLFNGQGVDIFQSGHSGGPAGQLLDGLTNITGDVAVGPDRQVYVTTGGGWVVAYPHGGFVPVRRYQFPDQVQPTVTTGIAIGNDGTLYAALYHDGLVVAYPKGNTQKASLVIPVPLGNTAYAVAVDSQNNLYIAYGGTLFGEPGFIERCAAGSTQCTDLGVTLGSSGYHLALDSQGNVIACDQLAGQIDIFPPNGGQPRVISQGLVGCGSFALNHDGSQLFVANQPHDGNNQGISVFDYASGKFLKKITAGIPADDLLFGVALSPAAQ